MPIPKPSETKQPILNYLTKAGKPVRVSAITELMGTHFKLSKKQMQEKSPKGTKRLAMSITASTKEMKAAGLVKSPRHGFSGNHGKGTWRTSSRRYNKRKETWQTSESKINEWAQKARQTPEGTGKSQKRTEKAR